jgi:LPXTG-motif cell wall-anchored protein
MPLTVADLAPLIVAASGGDPSTAVMPFVLLGAVVVFVGALLFIFGRRRRRQ